MANYFEKVLYLYPGIQGVMYWFTQSPDHNETGKPGQQQCDGVPWKNPYDGLIWENQDIAKPTQKDLDVLDDNVVDTELANRAEKARKDARDIAAQSDLSLMALYDQAVKSAKGLDLTQYLDQLETIKAVAASDEADAL